MSAKPFDNVVKEGWLMKQGSIVKSWKRRWVVLGDEMIKYYTDETYSVEKGSLQLTESTTVSVERTPRGMALKVGTKKRDFYLIKDTKDDLQEWQITFRNIVRKIGDPYYVSEVCHKERMRDVYPPKQHVYSDVFLPLPCQQMKQTSLRPTEFQLLQPVFESISKETKESIMNLIEKYKRCQKR